MKRSTTENTDVITILENNVLPFVGLTEAGYALYNSYTCVSLYCDGCVTVAPDRTVLTSWMNNISFISPPSPLLSQGPDIPPEIFCPIGRSGFPQCPASAAADEYCECVYVIKVPLGAVTQIVIGDLCE
jgi:hypothetical protein